MCKSRTRKPARLPKIRQRYQNDTKNCIRTAYFSSPGRPGSVARFRPATGHPPRLLLLTNRTTNMTTNKVTISLTHFYSEKRLFFPFSVRQSPQRVREEMSPKTAGHANTSRRSRPARADKRGDTYGQGSVRKTKNGRSAVFGRRKNGFFTKEPTRVRRRPRPTDRKRRPAPRTQRGCLRQVADTFPQMQSDPPDIPVEAEPQDR